MEQVETQETAPEVATAVSPGVRASLLDAKVFPQIRGWMNAIDPGAAARLDAARPDGWVRADDYLLMLEGAAAILGLDGLRELARTRTRNASVGSLFPNIVQSWTRSFAGDPVAVARIVEPLVRASSRNVGAMELRVSPGQVTTRWTRNRWIARSPAWRAHVQGTTEGIHDLAGTHVTVSFEVVDEETVDLILRWAPETAA